MSQNQEDIIVNSLRNCDAWQSHEQIICYFYLDENKIDKTM